MLQAATWRDDLNSKRKNAILYRESRFISALCWKSWILQREASSSWPSHPNENPSMVLTRNFPNLTMNDSGKLLWYSEKKSVMRRMSLLSLDSPSTNLFSLHQMIAIHYADHLLTLLVCLSPCRTPTATVWTAEGVTLASSRLKSFPSYTEKVRHHLP